MWVGQYTGKEMERGGERLKFLADNMLGRLARFMRILGYDTSYPNIQAPDTVLIEISQREGRILLSRDKQLNERWNNTFLITSDRLDDQLHQVTERFIPQKNRFFSRCTACNGLLIEFDAPCKEKFYEKEVQEVKHCDTCGKCYWKGTHTQNIMEYLRKLGIANES